MIIKAMGYFYYRIYYWQLRKYGQSNGPSVPAFAGVSFLIFLNILTIEYIILIFTGIDLNSKYLNFLKEHHISKLYQMLIGLITFTLVERVLDMNNVYNKLEKKYKKENSFQKLKGTIFIWLYIVSTFFILILFVYIAGYAKNTGFTVLGCLRNYF